MTRVGIEWLMAVAFAGHGPLSIDGPVFNASDLERVVLDAVCVSPAETDAEPGGASGCDVTLSLEADCPGRSSSAGDELIELVIPKIADGLLSAGDYVGPLETLSRVVDEVGCDATVTRRRAEADGRLRLLALGAGAVLQSSGVATCEDCSQRIEGLNLERISWKRLTPHVVAFWQVFAPESGGGPRWRVCSSRTGSYEPDRALESLEWVGFVLARELFTWLPTILADLSTKPPTIDGASIGERERQLRTALGEWLSSSDAALAQACAAMAPYEPAAGFYLRECRPDAS